VGPLLGVVELPDVAGGEPGGCEVVVLFEVELPVELAGVPDCEPVGRVISGGTRSESNLPPAHPG
jgi:hypothetical protein